jgi:hypothetical protein
MIPCPERYFLNYPKKKNTNLNLKKSPELTFREDLLNPFHHIVNGDVMRINQKTPLSGLI